MRADWRLIAAAVLAVGVSAAGTPQASGQDDPSVPPLPRFEGLWFEIVAYGPSWQGRCVQDTTLEIIARAPASAALRVRCRTATRVEERRGRLRADAGDGRWRTSFAPRLFAWIPAVWEDFWVIAHDDHDPEISWMAVGDRSRARLAVLARTRTLDEAAVARAIAAARQAGFAVDRLRPTRHDPDAWRRSGTTP